MKIVTAILILLALLNLALALADSDPNSLCIDLGETNCAQGLTAGTARLVLGNLQDVPAIESWQGTLRLIGGVSTLGYTLAPGCVNFASPPDFVIGCAIPVVSGSATLLSFSFVVAANDPVYFYIDDFSYNGGGPWQPCTGVEPTGEGRPLACINCDCLDVVPAEGTSWGAIRATYH